MNNLHSIRIVETKKIALGFIKSFIKNKIFLVPGLGIEPGTLHSKG